MLGAKVSCHFRSREMYSLIALGSESFVPNPTVYGYKYIIIFLLYIYASNHANDQCTKCAVMLREENAYTIVTVVYWKNGRFMELLAYLCC